LEISKEVGLKSSIVLFLQKNVPLFNSAVEDVVVGIFSEIADNKFGRHFLLALITLFTGQYP